MSNETKAPKSRNELRSALLSSHKAKSEMITIFGVEVEFRQPTLDAILSAKSTQDSKERTVDMIIKYAYVPGTNEQVFEAADKEQILRWPFGEDMIKVQQVIARLSGIDVSEATKELNETPLGE